MRVFLSKLRGSEGIEDLRRWENALARNRRRAELQSQGTERKNRCQGVAGSLSGVIDVNDDSLDYLAV
jgi:hypothetical protein